VAVKSQVKNINTASASNGGASVDRIEKALKLLAARERYQESDAGKETRRRAQAKQQERQREERLAIKSLKAQLGVKTLADLIAKLDSQ